MSNGYVICTDDADSKIYFAGWDGVLGGAKKIIDNKLAFRMQYPIAMKDKVKLEAIWNRPCSVETA